MPRPESDRVDFLSHDAGPIELAERLQHMAGTIVRFFAEYPTPTLAQYQVVAQEIVDMHLVLDQFDLLILGIEVAAPRPPSRYRRRAVQAP